LEAVVISAPHPSPLSASGARERPAQREREGQKASGSVDHCAIAAFLAAVIAVKLAVLFGVGPTVWPDTGGYLAFADAIQHGQALRPLDLTHGPAAPDLVFRLAGYPLVLAITKLISPAHYREVTVIVQIALNILAVTLIITVLEKLNFKTAQILLALGLYLFSDSLLLDNSLLSDSVYASLFNIVVFSLLGCLAARWRLTATGAAVLGVVWGFSTWTRDSGLYLTYLPVILLLLIARDSAATDRHRLGPLLAFVVVALGMAGAYAGFNKYRTGEFFFSITGIENWLRPAFDMAQNGYAKPFTGNDLVSRTVREGMLNYDYPSQLAVVERLHRRCQCPPTQLETIVFDEYLATVWRHPFAYLREVWRNFHYFGLVGLVADPVATLNQFFEFGTPLHREVAPGLSLRSLHALGRRFSAAALTLMLVNALSTAVAMVLFSLFFFGVPYLALRARHRRRSIVPTLIVVGFLWFSFVSVSLVFSLVHYEARHALPILPAGAIGTVYALFTVRRLLTRRAAAEAPV
jgi:hypothetical protein